MILVHHRGTFTKIGQIANQRRGIARLTPALALLNLVAEQKRLSDNSDARPQQEKTLLHRRNGQADAVVCSKKLLPAGNLYRSYVVLCQRFLQDFLASDRVSEEQGSGGRALNEISETFGRIPFTRIDSDRRHGCSQRFRRALTALKLDCRPVKKTGVQLIACQIQPLRLEQRAVAIMAPLLETLAHFLL